MQEVSQDYRTLAAYLKVRGLPIDTVTLSQAGIEFAGPNRCREALGLKPDPYDKRLGIIYHYPGSTYSTVRWFGKYLGAFGTVIDRKTDNPVGREMEPYLSPLNDWSKYDNQNLYVCESVLKALVLSRTGRYAIAGSGVWGLCPKEQLLIPESLRDGTRKVTILFDNDWRRNAQVRAAIRRLGNRLTERWGVEVKHGQLPDPPTGSPYWDAEFGKNAGKWGVDDAIAYSGEAILGEVKEVEIEPTEREIALDEFNERYAVCSHPPCIIAVASGHKYSRADFTGLLEAHRKVWADDKPIEVSKLWLSYEDRTAVKSIEYRPGGAVIGENYNEWRDTGPVGVEGDISPFLQVYDNAIPDATIRTLLLKSFAWILQNRGTKLDKSFILVGRQVGTGKSLLAKTFGTILGASNYASIGVEDFASDFNSAFAAKELVLVDDLHRMGAREVAKLKRYTTADKIVVNQKNVRQYEINNTAVFIITTNEYAAVAMDDVERRNLVVSFDPLVHYPTGDPWWAEYLAWLDDGGYGRVRGWLEGMDLSGFDPHYMPPMTETKKKMISMGRDDLENLVLDLYDNVDGVLGDNKRSVYTTEELWFIFYGQAPLAGDKVRLGKALANKFDQVAGGRLQRYFESGSPARLWIVRKGDWDTDKAKADIRAHRVVS